MIDRFVTRNKRSELYREAVEVLQRLFAAEGLDHVSRAFAEVMSPAIRAVWVAAGVKESQGHPCIQRLLGKRCDPYSNCNPPAGDHCSLWVKEGKATVLVSQPYGLSWASLQETVDYCRRLGLEARVGAGLSWHFPGTTIAVFYTRSGTVEG